ncbi:MAG: hypothetical protein RIB58_09430 [Phycisphaerales bacterium]
MQDAPWLVARTLAAWLAQAEAEPAASPAGPSAAQQTAQWVLILAAVALLTWVFMRLQWKRQRRTEDDDPVVQMRETISDRRAEGERAAEAAGIVHELAARLETKAARLEALLDRADERIARLEEHGARLEDRLAANGLERSLNGRDSARDRPSAGPKADPAGAIDDAPGDPWADDAAAGEPRSGPGRERAHAPPAADPLHQEVYDLADAGEPPLAIARRLDQQVGTIELILALRR